MKKYFESKVRNLKKEDFTAGPMDDFAGPMDDFDEPTGMHISDTGRNSILAGDDQDETPPGPNGTRFQGSMERLVDDEDEEERERPSNEYVLNVAFFSFVGFMAVQAVFALIAHSESMLADSEAMSVDSLTYLFNLCAERIKNQPYSEYELSLPNPVRARRRIMKRLYLELVPPLISVTALIIVTVVAMKGAWRTLFGDNGVFSEPEDVDVGLMLIFSIVNLLLDIVNVACFARADQAVGLACVGLHSIQRKHKPELLKMTSGGAEVQIEKGITTVTEATPLVSERAAAIEQANLYGDNLNMCSAWTHVFADTLRSLAVLIAASVATVFENVENESADATAAVVVCVIILVSLFPLMHGLFLTAREIVILSRTPIQ